MMRLPTPTGREVALAMLACLLLALGVYALAHIFA
jgi:hypothetical protein